MPSKELVVSQNRHETKVAILEDGQLVEVYFQRENEYSLAGSIHKGRVTRVLPGMQSAFVDLGLERDTFLYVSDFFEEHGDDIEKIPTGAPVQERRERGRDRDRGGDRGGDRGRDRGRERDRYREPQPAPEIVAAPETVEPVEAGEPALPPVPQEASAPVVASETAPVAAPPVSVVPHDQRDQQDQRDRRGRRSRRRRNRGRGFPDSKYAAASDAPHEPGESFADAHAEPAEEEVAEEFTLLPGESLARYRHTDAEPESVHHVPEPAARTAEPIRPTETLPAEPVSPATAHSQELDELEAEAVEQILERVEEEMERAALITTEPEAQSSIEEAEAEAEEEGEEDEGDDEPETGDAGPEAAGEESAEAEDSEGPETEAGLASPEEGGEPVPGEGPVEGAPEEGVEPARIPQSLTATLRAQGGRFPHRTGGRRSRRRGGRGERGDRGDRPPQQAGPVEEAIIERTDAVQPAPPPEHERAPERTVSTSISELLKEGQEIIVQIAKEPLGQKGARITSHIALPGRYVVYMPTVEHLGVSRKIGSDEERHTPEAYPQTHRQGMPGRLHHAYRRRGQVRDGHRRRYAVPRPTSGWTFARRPKSAALRHSSITTSKSSNGCSATS